MLGHELYLAPTVVESELAAGRMWRLGAGWGGRLREPNGEFYSVG